MPCMCGRLNGSDSEREHGAHRCYDMLAHYRTSMGIHTAGTRTYVSPQLGKANEISVPDCMYGVAHGCVPAETGYCDLLMSMQVFMFHNTPFTVSLPVHAFFSLRSVTLQLHAECHSWDTSLIIWHDSFPCIWSPTSIMDLPTGM